MLVPRPLILEGADTLLPSCVSELCLHKLVPTPPHDARHLHSAVFILPKVKDTHTLWAWGALALQVVQGGLTS